MDYFSGLTDDEKWKYYIERKTFTMSREQENAHMRRDGWTEEQIAKANAEVDAMNKIMADPANRICHGEILPESQVVIEKLQALAAERKKSAGS